MVAVLVTVAGSLQVRSSDWTLLRVVGLRSGGGEGERLWSDGGKVSVLAAAELASEGRRRRCSSGRTTVQVACIGAGDRKRGAVE